MALSTYAELQAAIRTEIAIGTGGITDAAIVDAITRAESKINRRARFREMEQLAYATYAAGTTDIEDRMIALPAGYLELINLRVRKTTEEDTDYVEIPYVDPGRIHEYYRSGTNLERLRYTLRKQIEFSHPVSSDHRVMMHYLKRWDIATDSTNWLLTNFPDAYLYGALAECEMHVKNDERIALWRSLFDEAIFELNRLDERGRDDSELDTSEVSRMAGGSTWNIFTG